VPLRWGGPYGFPGGFGCVAGFEGSAFGGLAGFNALGGLAGLAGFEVLGCAAGP